MGTDADQTPEEHARNGDVVALGCEEGTNNGSLSEEDRVGEENGDAMEVWVWERRGIYVAMQIPQEELCEHEIMRGAPNMCSL